MAARPDQLFMTGGYMIEELREKYEELSARSAELRRFL
jgi:hypothetical protein